MKRDWQAVNLADVEQQIARQDFIHKSACGCDMPIHTFVEPGDQLEGRLRPCPSHDRADRAGAFHLYIPTRIGEIGVAIRMSSMLRQIIFDNNLWGQYIRITYKGSIPTRFGHAKKIYLVEVDKGTATERFEEVPATGKKQRKPRKRRPIRRPAAVTTILLLAILTTGCNPLKPDGFSVGILTTKIPGQGPMESKQVYGAIFSVHYNLGKGNKHVERNQSDYIQRGDTRKNSTNKPD